MSDRTPVTDETAEQVIDLYVNQGAKLKDITEATGVPRSTIYWILQKASIDPQRQGTRRADPRDREAARESLGWAMQRVEALAVENAALRAEVEQLRSELVDTLRQKIQDTDPQG